MTTMSNFPKINLFKKIEKTNGTINHCTYLPFLSFDFIINALPYHTDILVDSGSALSLLSRDFRHILSKDVTDVQGQKIVAVNHSEINTFGAVNVSFTIDNECFQHKFIVADIGCSILGFDFLELHGITIETNPLKLSKPKTQKNFSGIPMTPKLSQDVSYIQTHHILPKKPNYNTPEEKVVVEVSPRPVPKSRKIPKIVDTTTKLVPTDGTSIDNVDNELESLELPSRLTEKLFSVDRAMQTLSVTDSGTMTMTENDEKSPNLNTLANYTDNGTQTDATDIQRVCAVRNRKTPCSACRELVQFLNVMLPENIPFPCSLYFEDKEWISANDTFSGPTSDRDLESSQKVPKLIPTPLVANKPNLGIALVNNGCENVPAMVRSTPMEDEPVQLINNIVEDKAVIDYSAVGVRDYLQNLFPTVFTDEVRLTGNSEVVHSIHLTEGYKKPYSYPVPYAYREKVKEKLDEMIASGILRPSSSQYSAPLVVVPKKDGRMRLCVDFRALNKVTVPDNYGLPHIKEIKHVIHGEVFSTLDLKDGFWQVTVSAEDIHKTAVSTPWGLFEHMRMPFGLRNAPPTFQRFVDKVLFGLPNVLAYIDDIVIFTKTKEEHRECLLSVFERLATHGLVINSEKSTFMADSVIYLGLQFDKFGYRPSPTVLPQIEAYLVPASRKDVQSFLGKINYYRTHIPNLAKIAAPLYDLTQKTSSFVWGKKQQESFDKLKQAFKARLVLVPVRPNASFDLYTDASGIACGAVLLQEGEPVEFYSRKFSPVEQRYSAHEREALAMVVAIKHFRVILRGNTFRVFTDHKPLLYWLTRPPANDRHARWLVTLQDMTFDIHYVKGVDNVLADLMSRPTGIAKSSYEDLHDQVSINSVSMGILSERLRDAQTEEFVATCKIAPEYLKIIDGFHYTNETGHLRLLVPQEFTEAVIKGVHTLGHFGRRRTYNTIVKSYFWPKMAKEVNAFVRSCFECQQNKVSNKVTRVYQKFPVTSRFRTVHIDLVGPLPVSSKGHTHILSILDRFSRWYEAVPLRSTTAEAVVEALWIHWISRFGLPNFFITDKGSQFESRLFNEVCEQLGVKHRRTTAYHPAANGLVERIHRTFKNSIRCLISRFRDWERALPSALLAVRTAISDLGVSPSLLVYGEQIAIPSVLLDLPVTYNEEDVSEFLRSLMSDLALIRDFVLRNDDTLRGPSNIEIVPPIDYSLHKRVWLKDPIYRGSFAPKYLGPFDIKEVQYPVVTLIKDGSPYKVSVDRIKPCFELRQLDGYERAQVDLDERVCETSGNPIPAHISTHATKGEGASRGVPPSANSRAVERVQPKRESVVTFQYQPEVEEEQPTIPINDINPPYSRPPSPTPPLEIDEGPQVFLDRLPESVLRNTVDLEQSEHQIRDHEREPGMVTRSGRVVGTNNRAPDRTKWTDKLRKQINSICLFD